MIHGKNFETFIQHCQQFLNKENILLDAAECVAYSFDYSRRQVLPKAIFFPENHEQVQHIIQLCNEYHIPLVPRGRGTGTPGGAVPVVDGIVISSEKINRIIEIDEKNRYAIVEPGVINAHLQQVLKPHGFFWPPDPSSNAVCSIGGNLAYNSAGPRTVKYGTPRENTLGLRAIIGSGANLRTGVYTTKGVVGYDLTRLLIGSEGTLGFITEATLKLTPLPETKRCLQAYYSTILAATNAVANIMQQSVIPCALEFMDHVCVDLIQKQTALSFPENTQALLIIEVDGLEKTIDESCHHIIQAAKTSDCLGIDYSQNEKDNEKLWQARKALSPTLREIAPKKISEDVVVPISYLAEFIEQLGKLAKEFNILIVNFGHAGNGNIHVNLLINPDDPQELTRANQCLAKIFALVIHYRGTLSGEHGVGLEKRDFIHLELDPINLQLMRAIKQQFDPNNIMNPGKLLPP